MKLRFAWRNFSSAKIQKERIKLLVARALFGKNFPHKCCLTSRWLPQQDPKCRYKVRKWSYEISLFFVSIKELCFFLSHPTDFRTRNMNARMNWDLKPINWAMHRAIEKIPKSASLNLDWKWLYHTGCREKFQQQNKENHPTVGKCFSPHARPI